MIEFSLTNLFREFVQFYCVVSPDSINGKIKCEQDAIDRINGGDCGTAALAVGMVISSCQPSLEFEYYDNFNHAFLRSGDLYYDTVNPNGVKDTDDLTNSHFEDCNVEAVSVEELWHRYIRNDYIGAVMIKLFLIKFGTEIPELVSNLVDKGTNDQYTLNWIKKVTL